MSRILCIDDHLHGLNARRVVLEGLGHTVSLARNGREGLNLFEKEKPDLVIVDYMMPQMKGDEVIREIKRMSPRTPVILLSGFADTLSLEEKVPEADCVVKKAAREVAELTGALTRLLRKNAKKPAGSVKAKTVKTPRRSASQK